jgi:hypothetical protein
MKDIKKRIMIVLVALMMAGTSSTKAQVFIMDDEYEGVRQNGYPDYTLIVPFQSSDFDEYTPLGGGGILMIGLSCAYLLSKRKKKQNLE